MGLLNKITNMLVVEEEFDEEVSAESRPVEDSSPERPKLTLHTNNTPKFKMLVFVPRSFDDIDRAADALNKHEAVLLNLSNVTMAEQYRICDFMNGVCYILKGDVTRINDTSMLYVPNNAVIDKELPSFSMPEYIKK